MKAPALDTSCMLRVEDLTMAYGEYVVQRNLTFSVRSGCIFLIMGGSGCGKSTLLRHLIGLKPPAAGRVFVREEDFWAAAPERRDQLMRRSGVLYQSGALWTSMTLLENVSLPLREWTNHSERLVREISSLKLALVGLAGFEDYYPSEISGGMRKRAALARAVALDPSMVFLDEPSAGLDPISAQRLDELVLRLRDSLGMTFVVVTHELASIFAIGDDSVFLDADERTMIARGSPRELLQRSEHPTVRQFLTRGGEFRAQEVRQ